MEKLTENVVNGWRSTIVGLAILALVGFCIHVDHELLKQPLVLGTMAAALYGVFVSKQ